MKTVRNTKDLSQVVRHSRKAMGFSQEHLAELGGVGRRFIVELESGKKESLSLGPTLRILSRLGLRLMIAEQSEIEPRK